MDTRLEYLCPTHHSSPHTPGGKEEGRKEEGRRDGVSSSLSQAGPSCRLMFVYNPSAQLGKFSVHCPPLGSINKVKLKAVRLSPSHPHTSLSTFHNLHNHTSHMHLRVHMQICWNQNETAHELLALGTNSGLLHILRIPPMKEKPDLYAHR